MYSPFMHADAFGSAALIGLGLFSFLAVIALVWTFLWKGLALWHAAKNGQKVWFIVMLVVNTFGILEIVYLVWFRDDRETNPIFPSKITGKKKAGLPVAESSPAD